MDLKTLARPIVTCLVVGLLTVVTDWQSAHNAMSALVPSLTDGARVCLLLAAGYLGVEGVSSKVQQMRADAPGNTPAR